jgi:hypothetical protein
MRDHRRLQRTLFRMQLDPGFAEALRRGAPEAVASTGLGAEDLSLVAEAPAAGVSADPGGRRRAQFLGNVASEYRLSTRVAARRGADPGLLDSFTSSAELHEAIASDRRLPPAFGRHARRRAEASGDVLLRELVALEEAMVLARREPVSRPSPGPGQRVLASSVRLVELARGTLEAAGAVRAALDADADARPSVDPSGRETLLLVTAPADSPHRLPEVSVESLGALPAALLRLAEEPVGEAELARLADEHGVEPSELEEFVASLVEEGLLVGG